MTLIQKGLAIVAVSAACLFGASSANAQWGWPFGGYYGGYYGGGPGVSIGIGGLGFYISGGTAYYGGYPGYPTYRNGYRAYNGYWFPPAAFAVRVAPGGYVGGSAHVQWCMQTYRSYRISDNTFQPYNGPRQQCISPY